MPWYRRQLIFVLPAMASAFFCMFANSAVSMVFFEVAMSRLFYYGVTFGASVD